MASEQSSSTANRKLRSVREVIEGASVRLSRSIATRLKTRPPRYQNIVVADIPEVTRPNDVKVWVIAGEVDGVRGPATRRAGCSLRARAGPKRAHATNRLS